MTSFEHFLMSTGAGPDWAVGVWVNLDHVEPTVVFHDGVVGRGVRMLVVRLTELETRRLGPRGMADAILQQVRAAVREDYARRCQLFRERSRAWFREK